MKHPRNRASRIVLNAEYGKETDFFGRTEQEPKYKPKLARRTYCFGSHKEKLQFETREKAARFIEYNAERIIAENGYAPSRAYWCDDCGCWHVTSKPKRKKSDFYCCMPLHAVCRRLS